MLILGVENMYYFISEIGQLDIATTDSFRKRADVIYEENLTGYVKLLMRRSFSKIIVRFITVFFIRNLFTQNYHRITLKGLSVC